MIAVERAEEELDSDLDLRGGALDIEETGAAQPERDDARRVAQRLQHSRGGGMVLASIRMRIIFKWRAQPAVGVLADGSWHDAAHGDAVSESAQGVRLNPAREMLHVEAHARRTQPQARRQHRAVLLVSQT